MTSIKQLNAEQLRQKNGLVHIGHRQKHDNSYLGIVGEYVDTQQNKLLYSGLLRDKDPLNSKKFVLFDKLELSPFTNDIDFKSIEKADLEVKNILTSGTLEFQVNQEINPNGDNIINPMDLLPTFEISAVTQQDIFTVINNVYSQLQRNLLPSDYFHILFDNANIQNQDYVLVKNQINLEENGVYKLFMDINTGYTYFKRINDETSALNTNSPLEVVITTEDDGKLVRYGRVDPLYYKIKSYLTNENKLQIEFTVYNGKSKTTYQNGSWDMNGDLNVSGDLTVDKSIFVSDNLTIGKNLVESVMNLTSESDNYLFDLNIINSCIYRCNSTVRTMTVTLPNVTSSSGRNLKIIKVDTSGNQVIIQCMQGQSINEILNESIVLNNKSDHIKFTCDGYEWFTM